METWHNINFVDQSRVIASYDWLKNPYVNYHTEFDGSLLISYVRMYVVMCVRIYSVINNNNYIDDWGFLPAPIVPSRLVAWLLTQQKYAKLFLKFFCNSLNQRRKEVMYKKLRWRLKKRQKQGRKIWKPEKHRRRLIIWFFAYCFIVHLAWKRTFPTTSWSSTATSYC